MNGDPLYDFAKLLQSLLGFDEAVFDLPTVPPGNRAGLLANFFSLVRARLAAWRLSRGRTLPHGRLGSIPRASRTALATCLHVS